MITKRYDPMKILLCVVLVDDYARFVAEIKGKIITVMLLVMLKDQTSRLRSITRHTQGRMSFEIQDSLYEGMAH